MMCSVFRSPRKAFLYLYVAEGRTLEELPGELLSAFGPAEFLIELDLSPDRQLASERVETVIANLERQGYHLQLPPSQTQGAEP